MKVVLSNAKKYTTDESGNPKEENFANLEVPKDDIKEVKLVQYEPETKNVNAIPENRQNLQSGVAKPRTYDKDESFFDSLIPMNNREAKNETIKYNEKNMETFNLTEEQLYNSNSGYRGRGRGRGRGGNYRGNNRGGGKTFNNNYGNNNYNNNNYNYSNNYNDEGNNYRNQGRGGYQNNNYRGGNRGSYGSNRGYGSNNRGGYGSGNRGNYGGYNNNNNNNRGGYYKKSNNFDDLNEDNSLYTNNLYQQQGEGMNYGQEKSIYDDKL
jgi:hypothetical protein